MDLTDFLLRGGLYAGAASFVGIVLLLPLYIQQRRDVRRLRDWAQISPDRGTAEFQAAQAAGIPPLSPERLARPVPATMATGTAPMPVLTPAQRVARELPAAMRAGIGERIPPPYREPRWRRFVRRPDPRYLIGIVLGVAILGIGIGVITIQLRQDELGGGAPARTPAVVPSEVRVAVLNATAVPGLAAKVGDDLTAGGFSLGTLTNSPEARVRSVVMFERGYEQEAEAVGRQLGIRKVQLVQGDVHEAVTRGSKAGGVEPASVVVIAGEDRAGL